MIDDRSARERAALQELLRYLDAMSYQFVTPTPATHRRVLARRPPVGTTPQHVLGWSLPFASGGIDPRLEQILADADVIEPASNDLLRARIRVSSLHGRLFLHSAFPTLSGDAVFLGPDSYRFADLIHSELAAVPPPDGSIIVDMGTGAGVGAIVAAGHCSGARVIMTDVNRQALALAAINARHAGCDIEPRHGRNLAGWADGVDIALANPPYIIDAARRAYRDGGGPLGAGISIEMTQAGIGSLKPGGRFILYTGSAIVSGRDRLKDDLYRLAKSHQLALHYRELDPDVFGEELDEPCYADVDRIAVIAAIFHHARSGPDHPAKA